MTQYQKNKDSETGFFENIVSDVENLRLYSTFDLLEREISCLRAYEERPELERMRDTYSRMLRYLSTGAPDPSRNDMTNSLRRDILAMADRLDFTRLASDSPGSYYSTARVLAHRRQPLSELIAAYDKAWLLYSTAIGQNSFEPDHARRYEETLQELFRAVMGTPPGRLSESESKMLIDRASDEASSFSLSSQIISALLIGLLEHYDRNRLSALLSIYQNSSVERVQAQALVGIMLALRYHHNRVEYDRELWLRIQAFADDLSLYPRLRDVYYTLLQTQDTKRIQTYFEKNVLPQIQKMAPEDLKKIMEGSFSPDAMENPEWAEKLENSDLGKKLRKLNEMQFDGGDMMVMAFSNLKMFPFFGSPGNWLLPFDSNHSAVRSASDEKMALVISFLEEADMMCDSDKYSFIFAISAVPQERREMMINSLSANFETIREQMLDVSSKETLFKKEVTRYLRNLYRLFTLSSKLFGTKRGTQSDPVAMLESGFDIFGLPAIGDILAQRDVIEIGAEYLFKRRIFSLSRPMLEHMLEFEDADQGRIWEKLGYIAENEGNYSEALSYYLKSELISPDNTWLNRHLAGVLEALGRTSEAIERYRRLSDDNDINSVARLGVAELRTGNVEEAVKIFRRLHFEIGENPEITFDRQLQPSSRTSLTPEQLAALWLSIAEIEMGEYSKAASHLPLGLPEPYLPWAILLSFHQGDYALTADALAQFKNEDVRSSSLEVLEKLGLLKNHVWNIQEDWLYSDFIKPRLASSNLSQEDFLLLSDSVRR